eukprot:maker-scaffold70_size417918-snap-gene-0.11 protein:Tk01870 transcript:maker-scaffold70_size417918-snap-gene-0.11-mRNA-1 annotation:"coiled-coil domain-containing protein 8"
MNKISSMAMLSFCFFMVLTMDVDSQDEDQPPSIKVINLLPTHREVQRTQLQSKDTPNERHLEDAVESRTREPSPQPYQALSNVLSYDERTQSTDDGGAESMDERTAESMDERTAESMDERTAESMDDGTAESMDEGTAESMDHDTAESRDNGRAESIANGRAESRSSVPEFPAQKQTPKDLGLKLRKCSVSLENIALSRDVCIKAVYKAALSFHQGRTAKPKKHFLPDFSPKPIPLSLLFPGGLPLHVLDPPPPPPPGSVRAPPVQPKRRTNKTYSKVPTQPPQILPRFASLPTSAPPSDYLSRMSRLFEPAQGPSCQVSVDKVLEMCKELDRAYEKIEKLSLAQIGYEEAPATVRQLTNNLEPVLDKSLGMTAASGMRLMDMRVLSLALEASQRCNHPESSGPRIKLYEMQPSKVQVDLATSFALVCTTCHKATIFPNSSFSKEYPKNFTVNKVILPSIGLKAYRKLGGILQMSEKPTPIIHRDPQHQAQLILSVDPKRYWQPMPSIPSPNNFAHPISPPSALPNGRGLLNGTPTLPPKPPTKIKASPLLPVGSRISVVAPGSRVTTSDLAYTTQEETGLKPGVYRVNRTGHPERVVVVKDPDGDPLQTANGPSEPSKDLEEEPEMQEEEEEEEMMDDEDDPPDFSHFLDIGLNDDDGEAEGPENANNDYNEDSLEPNENSINNSEQYLGWQDDDERVHESVRDTGGRSAINPLSPMESSEDEDDGDWGWKGKKKGKKRKKTAMTANKTKKVRSSPIPEIVLI